jgi:hypothetical protein
MGAKFKSKTHLLNCFYLLLAPFFVHLASKFEKSTNMTFKKKILIKKVSKNSEFHAAFKSVGKVKKNAPKKQGFGSALI